MARTGKTIRVTPDRIFAQWAKDLVLCDREIERYTMLVSVGWGWWASGELRYWQDRKDNLIANKPKPTR